MIGCAILAARRLVHGETLAGAHLHRGPGDLGHRRSRSSVIRSSAASVSPEPAAGHRSFAIGISWRGLERTRSPLFTFEQSTQCELFV